MVSRVTKVWRAIMGLLEGGDSEISGSQKTSRVLRALGSHGCSFPPTPHLSQDCLAVFLSLKALAPAASLAWCGFLSEFGRSHVLLPVNAATRLEGGWGMGLDPAVVGSRAGVWASSRDLSRAAAGWAAGVCGSPSAGSGALRARGRCSLFSAQTENSQGTARCRVPT